MIIKTEHMGLKPSPAKEPQSGAQVIRSRQRFAGLQLGKTLGNKNPNGSIIFMRWLQISNRLVDPTNFRNFQ